MTKKNAIDKVVQKIIIRSLIVIILAASQIYIWNWVESLADRLHNQRTIEQQIVNLEAQLAELDQQAGAQLQVDNQIDTVTIQQDEISQAIERLEQKAQELQLKLSTNSIVTEPVQSNSNFSPLVITVTAQGPLERLFQYMEALEYLTEVTSIRDFSFVANPRPAAITGESIHTLSMNIVFLTDKLEGDVVTAKSKRNFTSNASPGAPGGSGASANIGIYILGGSVILLLIAFVYKVRQRQTV